MSLNIGSPDIRGFLIKHSDGSESTIACQQAALEAPFICFWRVNGQWSSEAFVTALNVASVLTITPLYKDGTRSAELFSQAVAEESTP